MILWIIKEISTLNIQSSIFLLDIYNIIWKKKILKETSRSYLEHNLEDIHIKTRNCYVQILKCLILRKILKSVGAAP